MKVKLNTTALQEALGLVTSIIPSRTPKPILQCLQLTAEANSVTVCATDLEVGIQCCVAQVEVEQEGQIVAPADKLAAIVRESVDEVLEFAASESVLHIRGADSHFTIYGHDPGQYPAVPGFDGPSNLEIKLERLQEGAELTVFAAARESTRYALNGILWEVKGKKLTLVATDGRRLAKAVVSLDSPAGGELPEGRIIVPAKAMALIDKVPHDESAKAAVRFMNNQVLLACGQVTISSNLVEGNFPKYEDIIPSGYDKKVVLSKDVALSAVRRAALLATEDSKGIKLGLSDGTLVFSSRAPETGDAQIDMTVEYKGPAIEIGFNPQFLIDMLRVIKTDEVELHLGESDRPGMMKSGSGFLYIVMPVNL